MNPRVSICTQVKNQPENLRKMIDSVRASVLDEWEIVLVDDGSTEDIQGLVRSYDDSRIKLHIFPENRGIPHGFNYAFQHAIGDYVQPLSADEFIDLRKLAFQVAYLDTHPEIGCVWGLPGSGPMGPRPSWEQYHLKAQNRSRQAWIRTLLRFENIPIGGASMLMRREIMQELGGFDPEFFHCSDLELFVRFFQKHDGRVLCHRWADADQPETRLTAPSEENTKRFQEDVKKLHAKHKIELPPMGRVTVGIPVHNMAKFIGKTLQSLAEQTYQDFDVIVLDDASTDDLQAVLSPWSGDLTLMKFEENMGVRHAVNAMLGKCQTEFFVSLAADDWVEPTFLEKCLSEFQKDPFLEFVASQTDFYDEEEKLIPEGKQDVQRIKKASNKSREQWLSELYYGNQYFGAGMYRSSALAEIGGFDVDAGVLCDYDVYLKLLQRENIKVIEENLTHTRIHDGNSSIGEGKIDGKWLKNKYSEIRKRYYAPRMKVIIATPFYEMRGFSPYIYSLTHTIRLLTRMGIEHEYWELSGDSYVDRAKNTLMTKFLEDQDATDLFIIDSDMQWDPAGFIGMLIQPEEVVVGSYPQKNAWGRFTSTPELVTDENGNQHPIGRVLPDGSALIKSHYLAGGFMRIKRSALQKFKDSYPQYRYFDSSADPDYPEREYVEFSTCAIAPDKNNPQRNLRWGEDRIFGQRLQAIGIDAWIYPNINFGHYGIKGWTGNFDQFLRGKASNEDLRNTQRVS
jgi:glycosyltransferase involved in cell wall biosynthesis